MGVISCVLHGGSRADRALDLWRIPPAADRETMTDEEKAQLEVWKVTIDVQKHFNDLSMRVRNFAITVPGALLAAARYALKDGATVTLLGRSFSLAGWV